MDGSATPRVDYGSEEAAMQAYLREGEKRAATLGNRGPIRFTESGELHPDILEAYWRCGFYVFEGVLRPDELADIERDLRDILDRLPVERGAPVDGKGRPALAADCKGPNLLWSKPLGDPFGGTDLANGRHPVKMYEPTAAADAPKEVVYLILGSLQFSEAVLRVYGHPGLLAVAAAINGTDFTPFNEALFIKEPGRGASVAWHQDGVTHWDSPDWDEGIHGFNFQVQLYPTTPANGLWVIPGSHKLGKADIKAMVEANGGSEQLPGAVPLVCEAGDVTMVNRQTVHGSFANTSPDLRISLTFGFHRRRSVLGQKAALSVEDGVTVHDERRVFERSAVIQVAIDARRQAFPDEPAFRYRPFAGLEDQFRFTPEAFDRVIRDYNTKDLAI
jgi:Phytanoyl-CoA dioxygenase (PhyH)